MVPGELAGRVALVTGAAGPGLGAACARRFAAAGAHVVVCDRSSRRVGEMVTSLREAEGAGPGVTPLVLDVTDADAVAEAVAGVLDALGRIDILVNNAAFSEKATLVDTPVDSWRRVLDVCLTGPFLLMRACLPAMYAQGSGAVVNVSSIEAWTGTAEHIGSYVAAKAGLLALTRTAADESGPHGVRVNAVAPGLMVNPAVEALFDAEQLRDVVRRTALRRAGTAEDVAGVVYFLATNGSGFVTGDVVNVSGGLYYHA